MAMGPPATVPVEAGMGGGQIVFSCKTTKPCLASIGWTDWVGARW